MAVFLVAYDLVDEDGSRDSDAFSKFLTENFGVQIQRSVWLINSSVTASKLLADLRGRKFVDKGDRLWVSEVTSEVDYINPWPYESPSEGVERWLKRTPPRKCKE